MDVGDSNSGLHGCAPSTLPTQHISPGPYVVKNEDCSLGCLWSQCIQNVWGRLLRSADMDGVLEYLSSPLCLLPHPPSLPTSRGCLQKVALTVGKDYVAISPFLQESVGLNLRASLYLEHQCVLQQRAVLL